MKEVSKIEFNSKTVSLAILLTALGVVIAPFFWFPFLTTKAYPGQHMINVVSGVLLGPLWAMVIAFFIGFIRMGLGIGTIYSMPGGLPGGLVVGATYMLLRKLGFRKGEVAAFTEPMGTVFIGGTLAVYLVAPLIGDVKLLGALIPVWVGWAVSSVPGSIIGFIALEALKIAGIERETFTERSTR